MQLEINNPKVASALLHMAEISGRPVSQVAEEILEEHLPRAEQVRAILDRLEQVRDELFAERGGRLFSDSAEIIRESRENDH